MLCRTLIAAIALTCTLSCIQAYGQVTQRLDRIKDLMCVFLLSGMQKEDLDVSMLTKLQRHNVNINGMNNEELLRECLKLQYNNSNNAEVTHFREPQPTLAAKYKTNILDDFNNKTFLTSLNSPFNIENEGPYNASIIHGSEPILIGKKPKYPNINKSNIDEVIQYKGQPRLENVLKFWHDMKLHKAGQFTEPVQNLVAKNEQESKRSVTENEYSTENDAISSLLTNFLSKAKAITNVPTTTTQRSVNIGNLYEQLYSLQAHGARKMSDNSGLRQKTSLEKENIKNEPEIKTEELNNTHLPELFGLVNTYNNYNQFNPDVEVNKKLNRNSKETLMFPRNPYLKNFQRSERIETTTNTELKHAIPQDVIKKIAESVKEIILRDLRKEIFQTTTIKTTTTTTATTTAIIESTIAATLKKEYTKAESMMNKFLELFEEIKSLKQNNMVFTNENMKSNNKIIRQNYDIDEIKVYPEVTVPIKTLPFFNVNQVRGLKQHPKASSGNILNFGPQLHKFRSNGTLIKQEINKGLLPITVQTNNIEIPPIGIPLDRPQNLINQNIIVTTMIPYRIVANNKGNVQRGGPLFGRAKPLEAYKTKQSHPRVYQESDRQPVHPSYSNYKDDVIRFTLNNNERSKYNADYYEKINIGKYSSLSDHAANEPKHQELPRFHEKLENVGRFRVFPEQKKYIDKIDCCDEKYAYSKAMVECCNRKIASRQQMSLNNMKRNSYDDTHFKNFLQSQQKVTDMLEKILSDKGNVQSVETA